MTQRQLLSAFLLITLCLLPATCTEQSVGSTGADAAIPDAAPGPDGGPDLDADTTPDAAVNACTGLDLHDCRLANGCAPDTCFECSCTPVFYGCRTVSDPPYQCPELGCPMPICCEESSDCDAMGLFCHTLDTDPGCGMCSVEPGNCGSDADCATGQICDPLPCTCSNQHWCTPGCTDSADCRTGNSCLGDPDHPRCLPTPCAGPADCPPDFDCGAGGECVRRTCTTEVECDGYCVDGACYPGLGVCAGGVP